MTDIAAELAKLHGISGAEFSRQVELIANMHIFHAVDGETNVFTAISEQTPDYQNQIRAAHMPDNSVKTSGSISSLIQMPLR